MSEHGDKNSHEVQIVKDYNIWAATKNETLDKPISSVEIYNLSKKFKSKKASSVDSLSNEIIKLAVKALPLYFVKIFNILLSKGIFSSAWANGNIVPIYKSGNTFDPGNYRGICISSCLGKFFTLIMNTRLSEFLEENNVINRCQIGFRKHHRTADHLLVLKTFIDFYTSHRKPIFACFIDFKKAYDSVWRKSLLFKLISCRCSKTFLRFISNMYSSVNYSVKLKDGVTPPFQSYIGLKQGCNLSPTLFNIFINDIPNLFNQSCDPVLFNQSCDPVRLDNTDLSCLLYADDLILLSESKAGLQKCLSKLEIYAKKWKLNINKKKSKILVFGTANQRRSYLLTKWYYENEALEQVDEYCYLGITIHFSGNFKKALKVLRDKALRAYNNLLKKFSNFENVPE